MTSETPKRARRFLALYVGWILLCALLFVLLRGAEDPSRRRGRILSIEAGRRALAELRARDRAKYATYEVVHVAGEGGRWVVLLDRVPHTRLREAVVVELRAADGALVRVRLPANAN